MPNGTPPTVPTATEAAKVKVGPKTPARVSIMCNGCGGLFIGDLGTKRCLACVNRPIPTPRSAPNLYEVVTACTHKELGGLLHIIAKEIRFRTGPKLPPISDHDILRIIAYADLCSIYGARLLTLKMDPQHV